MTATTIYDIDYVVADPTVLASSKTITIANPFTLSLTQFSPDKIYHLSCGYGPLWKISKKGPITHTSSINIGFEKGKSDSWAAY